MLYHAIPPGAQVILVPGIGGQAIEGFSVEQCDLIHTCNEVNRTVSWQGNSDLHTLAGKPIRLQFAMRGCDLYAFQFQNIAKFGVSRQTGS